MLAPFIQQPKWFSAPQESDIIKEAVFFWGAIKKNESLCGFNSTASHYVCLMELYGSQAVLGPLSNIPTKYPALEQTLDGSTVVGGVLRKGKVVGVAQC